MNDRLLARLRSATAELNLAAVDEEYKDPFWSDRYGERGRRHAVEDGQYHFSYVAEAVAAGSMHLLERYARWLRSVLVARGMCSEHLADGFRIRARLLTGPEWPDAGPALAAFGCADAALRYHEGPAAGLVPAATRPADRIGDESTDELRILRSYLADALALARPTTWIDHAVWRVGFDARRGRPRGHTRALLDALHEQLAGSPAAAMIDDARSRLP